MFNLRVFPLAQQIIISSLIEEIGWLKERVGWLERQASPLAPAPDAPEEVLDAEYSC